MTLEIEAKFKLKCSFEHILNKLSFLKPIYVDEYFENDTYFNHPCRDFKSSDEAIRLRTICSSGGESYYLTYKGSRIPGLNVKKRIEYETRVENPVSMKNILVNLGFTELISFSKKRKHYVINKTHLYLDELLGIGLFIEIEGLEDDIFRIIDFIKDCVERIDKTYLEICIENSNCIYLNTCK
uniref:Class IV adenylate cyclase n=1 Tax=Staphylothermus marinus TaxID=2280 RepID=A0A7C4HEX4_STAMA